MIQSKEDLTEYLKADRTNIHLFSSKQAFIANFANYPVVAIRKYLTFLRKQEYYINTARGNKLKGLLGLYYERKKNRLGMHLGIEIGPNCFGKGLCIYHTGNIVVNVNVRAGENCRLHGCNCIGNNGKSQDVPRLGNDIDIGFGAVIIGNIEIADRTVVGANAVVNHSVTEVDTTVAGIPASKIKSNNKGAAI